jgi:hypothetical protein
MKIIIAGSRNITDKQILGAAIADSKWFEQIDEIVSGHAKGVDQLGEGFAKEYNIPVKQFLADWDTHGKKAGYIRNIEMATYADVLLAIWDGKSKGTKHMIDYMKKLNKPVFIYLVEN